jgi:uncharacterized protein
MKIYDSSTRGQNSFTGYGDDFVTVNGTQYRCSLLVTMDTLTDNWPVTSVSALTAVALESLPVQPGGIILLGTGPKQAFPDRQVLRTMAGRRIAVEVMDTAAACRTFNLLNAEGRVVLAAIIQSGN